MKTSYLSPFRKPRGTDLVTASELIPGINTRLLLAQVKCLDPGVASRDQKPDSGDSLRHQIPTPCPHPPPPSPRDLH